MNEIVFAVEQAPEGGYIARALGHSIFTESETEQELRDKVRDAVRCHFDEGTRLTVIRLKTGSHDDRRGGAEARS